MSASVKLEEELFTAALALPPEERERYMQRACGDDRQLRARVESLLAAVDPAEDFIDRQRWGLAAPVGVDEPGDIQIGPYKLLREIGEGGCGVVFLAEQAAPVRRQVALKIIKLGMDTRAVIARFDAERQALALMDHPNIAKVLDAGATPTGRPYFAMELVRGIKVTEYCDHARLSTAERLALFVQICHAIQHAHHKGIVHRDIKPSNVLVTLHDGVAMVKVIDFGIAKATQGRLTDQTLYTALDQFMGTPAYVSPEQTDLGGSDVDARSDIYSLGVLLYELLTGCLPFDAPQSSTGLDELRRRIRSEEPPTPSKRLRAVHAEPLTTTALRRGTTATKLIEVVHGDLDWIVMRCLEKDRERRYATADALAADVQRFLNHEPILARPPGFVYSLSKFARRHRLAFAAGATVALVLIIATVVSAWLAVRATRAENLARTEAASRQEVIDFLQNDLLAQASPDHEPDRDLKLRTVLDRAATKIEGRFADQPLVEAAVRTTLGETYDSLGESVIAQAHLDRAYELYRRELGEAHVTTLQAARSIADVLMDRGEYHKARQLGQEMLATHERVLGPEHADTLDATGRVALSLYFLGDIAGAAAMGQRTLEGRTRVLGPTHRDTLVTMNDVATFHLAGGNPTAARQLLQRALELEQQALGEEHPETLMTMTNLASAHSLLGDETQAELLHTRALKLRERVLGADHPTTLTAMNNVAFSQLKQGRLLEAEQLLERTLQIVRGKLGAEHPSTFATTNNLAMTYLATRKFAAANEILSASLDVQTRQFGADHPQTLLVLSNLGVVRHRLGQLAQSEELQARALEAAKRVLGQQHPDTLTYTDHLAAVWMDRGKYAEAEALLRPNSETRRKLFPDQWRTFATQSLLGEALVHLRRHSEAEPLLISAYQGLAQRARGIPPYYGSTVPDAAGRILELYSAWHKPGERRKWERELAAQPR